MAEDTKVVQARVLIAALALVAAAFPGFARGDGKEPANPPTKEPTRLTGNLVMAISAPQYLKESDLLDDFEDAKKLVTKCDWKNVKVRPIPQSHYEFLADFIAKGFIPPEKGKNGPLQAFSDQKWIIDLEDPDQFVRSVKVAYVEDKKEGSKEYTCGKEAKDRVHFHSPGRFTVEIEPNLVYKSYEIFVDAGEKQPPKSLGVHEWPKSDLHYWLLEVEGFSAEDPTELFAVLQDGEHMANPVKEIVNAKAATVVVGTFTDAPLLPPLSLVGTDIKFHFPPISGKEQAARIWMLFPVDEQTREKIRADLQAKKTTKEILETVDANSAPVEKGVSIVPNMKPVWFEIPKVKGVGFERTLSLGDVQKWKDLKDARVWRFYLFEFDNGEAGDKRIRRPIRVTQPDDPANKVYIVEEEVNAWPLTLKELKP